MILSIRHTFFTILLAILVFGCSKNADTLPPENIVDEDTVSNPDEDTVAYPVVMFLTPERKGLARLFSNGQEIHNLEYAKIFVEDAVKFYFYNWNAARKIQFESKDTVSIFYTDQPAMYGIHRDDTTYFLHSQYPFASPENVNKDTSMFYYRVNPETGFYHSIVTAYGDLKEFRIPAFVSRQARYTRLPNGDTSESVVHISARYSAFKESHMQTLGPLDTLGIQEYELVYRPR